MSGETAVPGRNIIVGLAALIIIYGLFGFADRKNVPYGGVDWGRADEVTEVKAGGPADQAGVQVGDRIISIGGVAMDDLRARQRQPRALIGETRDFVVERTDQATGAMATQNIPVTYTGQPTSPITDWLPGMAIGLVFLLLGVLVYLKVPSQSTLLFCALCFCFALIPMPGPYIASYGLRMVQAAMSLICFLGAFAFLLHLLLLFPKRKQFLEKPGAWKWVYIPGALVALLGIILPILQPEEGTFTENLVYLLGIVFLGYLVLSMVAMIHSFVKATSEERAEFGLNYVLWSVTIGLFPVGLMAAVGMVSPDTYLPGGEYYFLALLLIPAAFAVALLRKARPPAVVL